MTALGIMDRVSPREMTEQEMKIAADKAVALSLQHYQPHVDMSADEYLDLFRYVLWLECTAEAREKRIAKLTERAQVIENGVITELHTDPFYYHNAGAPAEYFADWTFTPAHVPFVPANEGHG